MGGQKDDYLKKKGLLRPENDNTIFIVKSTTKGVTMDEYSVTKVSDEHILNGVTSRNYFYEGCENIYGRAMDVNKREGVFNRWPDTLEDEDLGSFAFFDKDKAYEFFTFETQKLTEIVNKLTLKDTIIKLENIKRKIDTIYNDCYNSDYVIERLVEGFIPQYLLTFIKNLMVECEGLEEHIQLVKEKSNELGYKAPRG